MFSSLIGQSGGLNYAKTEKGEIKGFIKDLSSGQVLSYVNIQMGSSELGSSSDSNGKYSIPGLLAGMHSIQFSYLGYEPVRIDSILLMPGETKELDIYLKPIPILSEEVVISATRKSQTLISAPVSLALVRSDQIENSNVNTFDEAFNGVTGVNVTRSSRANIQALSIRGASEVAGGGIGNRVLLLIDGRPALSPDSGGALWNLVPVNSIDKIEIVKGAYSSLFGSSAMGGVVNVITKDPSTTYLTRIKLKYGFYQKAPSYSEYNQFNDFRTLGISHSNRFDNSGYLVDFSFNDDDGHREKSGFSLYNFYGKYKYDFSQTKSLKVSANYNHIDNDTPATWLSRTQAYSVAPHRQDDFQDRREYNADLFYSAIRNDRFKYSSRLYYYHNNSKFSFNDNPADDSTNVNIGSGQIIDESSINAFRIGSVNQFDLSVNEKHYIIGGIDWSFDKIVALPDTVLYGRHKAQNFGIYVQDEYYLHPKFTMTGGIRYDYYNILNEFSESNFSPKIAFVYSPNTSISIRSLFAQAFRNPAIGERFIKFEQGGGLRFQPNPNLRSEKLKFSWELGSRVNFKRSVLLDFAVFYNNYKDLISFQQIANPQGLLLYEVINLNSAIMQGFEVSLNLKPFWNVQMDIAYTFLDAKDASPNRLNDALPYKRKHSFNFSSGLEFDAFNIQINGRYKSGVNEVSIYPGSEPSSHFILSSKLNLHINKSYSAFIAFDNITNTQYEELERYRMPGRSLSVGASMNIRRD